MTIDDDLDGMDERQKINYTTLARAVVKAQEAARNRRPSWSYLLRHGCWQAGLRGWKRKPRWGLFSSYYDGDWWVTFHLGSAWIECTTHC